MADLGHRLSALALNCGGLAAILMQTNVALAENPGNCEDLSAIPESPGLVFEVDIQPLLENCLGCHGGSGGLSLAPEQAYAALIGVASNTQPDRLRVDPGAPAQSVLFLAINCDQPGGPSFRMPGLGGLEDQALIRDWILQGAGDFVLRDRFESTEPRDHFPSM